MMTKLKSELRLVIELLEALPNIPVSYLASIQGIKSGIDYHVTIEEQLNLYRSLTGNKLLHDNVIILQALKQYNATSIYGVSDEEIRGIVRDGLMRK